MKHATLLGYWRKAVRASKGEWCYTMGCRNPASGCHHLIKVRYRTTAYRVENGIPLCAVCHPIADRSPQFALDMIPQKDYDFIKDRAMYNLQEWRRKEGQTLDEFHKSEVDELKRIISEGE